MKSTKFGRILSDAEVGHVRAMKAHERAKRIAAQMADEGGLSLGSFPYLDGSLEELQSIGLGDLVKSASEKAVAEIVTPTVEVWRDGRRAKIPKPTNHKWQRKEMPWFEQETQTRGKVVSFSARSRIRLMSKVAEVQREVPCHFVSLTFPDYSTTPEQAKEFLWAWWRRFERKFPKVGMIWKIEPQERGTPHFHLLIFGAKYIPHLWAKATWADVLQSAGYAGAFHRGVDLKFVPGSWRVIAAYITKYFSKPVTMEGMGRVWGCRGRTHIPWATMAMICLTERDLTWIWRLIARKRKKNLVSMSVNWLSDIPDRVIECALILSTQERERIEGEAVTENIG